MTRYFLFEYDDYYPCGGFNDLAGIFESENDALASLKDKSKRITNEGYSNVEIYSLESDSNEPNLLYNMFYVLDTTNSLWLVIGNAEKKVIKLTGRNLGVVNAESWGSSRYTKMNDCKMEAEL